MRTGTAQAIDDDRPVLCVIVDTEEEFDWSRPLSRANRSVTSIRAQERAQAIFARFGIVPTYVVDHPVATDMEAVSVLKAYLETGACEIGAHLHPWVNPPFEEDVTPRNSYPGNLPADLERRKLACLSQTIADAFGITPRVYKAGRYGIGPNTPTILEDLGFLVDTSVVPYTSFATDGGPDFTQEPPGARPMAGSHRLLELPLSVGFAGRLSRFGPGLHKRIAGPAGMRWHLPGICARTRLLERIRLSPEGQDWRAHKRLTKALLGAGERLLCYTYHSPSLLPGCTPYVRTGQDLHRFLDNMERYFDYAMGACGARPRTATQIHAAWRAGLPVTGQSCPAAASVPTSDMRAATRSASLSTSAH